MYHRNMHNINEKNFNNILEEKENENILIENKILSNFTDTVSDTIFINCIFVSIEDSFFENCVFISCSFYNIDNSDIKQSFFKGCDFKHRSIYFSNFNDVKIHDSDFFHAIIVRTIFKNIESSKNSYFDLQCPEKGEFIAYKKLKDFNSKYICKLLIPSDAKRSSATTKKCRCSKAKVLEIIDIRTREKVNKVLHIINSTSPEYPFFTYTVNEYVYPDSFDDNRWNECSNGIHFFMDKKEALDY